MNYQPPKAQDQFDQHRQAMLAALRWLTPEQRAEEVGATISALRQLQTLMESTNG